MRRRMGPAHWLQCRGAAAVRTALGAGSSAVGGAAKGARSRGASARQPQHALPSAAQHHERPLGARHVDRFVEQHLAHACRVEQVGGAVVGEADAHRVEHRGTPRTPTPPRCPGNRVAQRHGCGARCRPTAPVRRPPAAPTGQQVLAGGMRSITTHSSGRHRRGPAAHGRSHAGRALNPHAARGAASMGLAGRLPALAERGQRRLHRGPERPSRVARRGHAVAPRP